MAGYRSDLATLDRRGTKIRASIGDLPEMVERGRTTKVVRTRQLAVKGNRNPARSLPYPLAAQNEYCVGRVLVDVALTTIKSFDSLRTAKTFMRRFAAHTPGSYLVFNNTTRRVLCRVVNSPSHPLC